ncbi:MAG: hypothetical protein KF689_10000 [Gemmatimonadaceae bacterium]|nr:hypothetical protein [Gemmatimonadaceae bacterium]MCW5826068.1 hypothetical protein [Gemmatimonadaceae bacterium]
MRTHEHSGQSNAERFVSGGGMHGMITGVLGLFFTVLLQAKGHVPNHPLVTLLGGVLGFGTGYGIMRMLHKSGTAFANSVYSPSGDSTAYTPTFSHIEALEIRGELDGAALAWTDAVAEAPEHAMTIVRAADFHLRARKDAEAAMQHYLRARALGSGTPDLRRYVQQKIVDLYLGQLRDEGRAMVELRRLIDGFPGTREAEGAREALAALKARRSEA